MLFQLLLSIPRGKEDLKCSTVAPKSRYSEKMESGVLYFVAREDMHGKRYEIESGNMCN